MISFSQFVLCICCCSHIPLGARNIFHCEGYTTSSGRGFWPSPVTTQQSSSAKFQVNFYISRVWVISGWGLSCASPRSGHKIDSEVLKSMFSGIAFFLSMSYFPTQFFKLKTKCLFRMDINAENPTPTQDFPQVLWAVCVGSPIILVQKNYPDNFSSRPIFQSSCQFACVSCLQYMDTFITKPT